ncbi:hypothetical protein BH23PLA1_BH23PLA1_33520 [soil metagenome]
MFWLWAFLIYWLLFFVGCYIVTEVGQDHFYDEVTPYSGLKVAGTTFLLAALMTWWQPMMLEMFTDDIIYSVALAILAFILFTLAIRFHPTHAAALGPLTVVLVAALAALAIESFSSYTAGATRDRRTPAEQRASERLMRKSAGGAPVPIELEADPKATPAPAGR